MANARTGAFAAWDKLSTGWKVVYGIIGFGILLALATTRFAPLVVVFLIVAIIYQLEHA